jgi:tRNA(Ile)-lysidine synthase
MLHCIWRTLEIPGMSRLDLALEQKVLRDLKPLRGRRLRVLMALSGGVDSMVMAAILHKWRRGLGFELAAAHVHHGGDADSGQRRYRDRVQRFVRDWAAKSGLPFFTNKPARVSIARSEAQLRALRHRHLGNWLKNEGYDLLAFAHHRDDLLETRVIRLIRGSGSQGLRAMCVLSREKVRPLLSLSDGEIRAYALVKNLEWIEDPSNASTGALRNWLRARWLPDLEKRRPGALKALSRSLETLAPRGRSVDLTPHVGVRRDSLSRLPGAERRALLARYLKGLGLQGYSRAHVEEILKRLDTERKNFTFEMLGLRFAVSPDFLWASRV